MAEEFLEHRDHIFVGVIVIVEKYDVPRRQGLSYHFGVFAFEDRSGTCWQIGHVFYSLPWERANPSTLEGQHGSIYELGREVP